MIRTARTMAFALFLLLPVTVLAAPAQYRLRVDGLACPFCAYGIEKELTRTDGVQKLDIDIKAGTVTVTMEEGAALTKAQADQIVKDAGFTLRDFGEVGARAKQNQE